MGNNNQCERAGKNIRGLRERFGITNADVFDDGMLAVTCTEDDLPKAKALIAYVSEFLRELEVGDVFKAAKVRVHCFLHLLVCSVTWCVTQACRQLQVSGVYINFS